MPCVYKTAKSHREAAFATILQPELEHIDQLDNIMALTTEVLIFEASNEFRDDPRLAIPAFEIVLKTVGVHAWVVRSRSTAIHKSKVLKHITLSPVYYGKQVDDPSTRGYIFLGKFHPLPAFDNFTVICRLGQL